MFDKLTLTCSRESHVIQQPLLNNYIYQHQCLEFPDTINLFNIIILSPFLYPFFSNSLGYFRKYLYKILKLVSFQRKYCQSPMTMSIALSSFEGMAVGPITTQPIQKQESFFEVRCVVSNSLSLHGLHATNNE